MDEAQAGINIARRNINNLKYTDDTTLMAESKVALKSLLINVKEESEKTGLKFNIQKTKLMVSSPITSWQKKNGGKVNAVTESLFFFNFIFRFLFLPFVLGLKNHCKQ